MNLKPSERIKELFKGLDVHDPYRQRVLERQIEAIILFLDEEWDKKNRFFKVIEADNSGDPITIIAQAGQTITLPLAETALGKTYVIKREGEADVTVKEED